jgi:hypothetical protein
MGLSLQDQETIKKIVQDVVNPKFSTLETKFGTLDSKFGKFGTLETKIDQLSSKVSSNHTVNVKHHVETRKMIGDLKQSHDRLREGLTMTASA